MIRSYKLPSQELETNEGRITLANSFLHYSRQYAILRLPSQLMHETELRQIGFSFPFDALAAPLHSDGIPRVGLRIQDERDSKSLDALALTLWTFSEDDAPKSLAFLESVRLRTRLSCGARFTDDMQGTVVERGKYLTH